MEKEEKNLIKPEQTKPATYEKLFDTLHKRFDEIYQAFDEAFKKVRNELEQELGELEKKIADYKITSDVKSEKDKYLVTFKLGKDISEKDIELEYSNNMLILNVNKEKKTKEGIQKHTYRRIEYLPHVEADKITTSYKDGVLSIEMPFQDKYVPKKIPINVKE